MSEATYSQSQTNLDSRPGSANAINIVQSPRFRQNQVRAEEECFEECSVVHGLLPLSAKGKREL